jgi:hypothetical protein
MSRRLGMAITAAAAALLAGIANGGTAGAAPAQDAPAVDPSLSEFVPTTPVRLLDTRSGAPLGPGGRVNLTMPSQVPAGATAAVVNITGTAPTAFTFVTAFPGDETVVPVASTLNLAPGQTRANSATVALSPDRAIALFNNWGNTHLIVDLAGFYIPGDASLYNYINPTRLVDTRNSAPVGPGGVLSVDLSFLHPTATAVTFNLTGLDATTGTHVIAYPGGQAPPVTSVLNLAPGEVVPNQVTVPIGADRKINLFNNAGNVNLIVDLAGYYSADFGHYFVANSPERYLDTRTDPAGPFTPEFIYSLTDGDADYWDDTSGPVVIEAAAANVTGLQYDVGGHLRVFPGGNPLPNTSNLNLAVGQTAANAVNVGIGFESDPAIQERAINFYTSAGRTDVILDISGFFVSINNP